MATCSSFPPCLPNNVSAAIFDLPPAGVVPLGYAVNNDYGGMGVPGHGMHWLWEGDWDLTTPQNVGTVPTNPPAWVACIAQYGGAPDMGCRVPKWCVAV